MSRSRLGVNIDHVATLRQARYKGEHQSSLAEPDVLQAALICQKAGAHGITVHLREDARHIQLSDVVSLNEQDILPLNLEMANHPEILQHALRIQPAEVCMVPERRAEVTTEGGLDVARQEQDLRPTVEALQTKGIRVSLFIDPDLDQVQAAGRLGVEMIELHTGRYSRLGEQTELQQLELQRLSTAAKTAQQLGLQVNAGHGLTNQNVAALLRAAQYDTLNIGHHLVSRAIFVGLNAAIEEMLVAMKSAAPQ
ncbi:MAG: pyridoxine 5'-phosphate synthase [Verrucomicrobiales bacterium]